MSSARVLVKFVAIPRSKLTTNWDKNWAIGCQRGLVKKIVEIRNLTYAGTVCGDEVSVSDEEMSPEDKGVHRSNETSLVRDTEGGDRATSRSDWLQSQTLSDSGMFAIEVCSDSSIIFPGSPGAYRSRTFPGSPSSAVAMSAEHHDMSSSIQFDGTFSDMDGHEGWGSADMGVNGREGGPTTSLPHKHTMHRWATHSDEEDKSIVTVDTLKDPDHPLSHEVPLDEKCWLSSRVQKLQVSSSTATIDCKPSPFIIQVFGDTAKDDIAGRALGWRACALLDGDEELVGFDVSNCPVHSMDVVVSWLCPIGMSTNDATMEENAPIDGDEYLGHALEQEVRNMVNCKMGHEGNPLEYYQVHVYQRVKHISFTYTKIEKVISQSLNKFENLVTLDLSNNSIQVIDDTLVLPSLTNLDISGNQLTSLDHLQGLIRLRSLNVSSNKLVSLHNTIHMLVALSGHLISLDMSMNEVCENARYADEVALLFPMLKYFDTVDVATATGAYTSHTNIAETPHHMSQSVLHVAMMSGHGETRRQQLETWRLSHDDDVDWGATHAAMILEQEEEESQRIDSSAQIVTTPPGASITPKAPPLQSPEPDLIESNKRRDERFRRAFSRVSRYRLTRSQNRDDISSMQRSLGDNGSRYLATHQNSSYGAWTNTFQHSRMKNSELRTDGQAPDLPYEKGYTELCHRKMIKRTSSSPLPEKGYMKPTASASMRYQSPLRESHELTFRHRSDRAEAAWTKSQKKLTNAELKQLKGTAQSVDSDLSGSLRQDPCARHEGGEIVARNRKRYMKDTKLLAMYARSFPSQRGTGVTNSINTRSSDAIGSLQLRVTEAVLSALEEFRRQQTTTARDPFGPVSNLTLGMDGVSQSELNRYFSSIHTPCISINTVCMLCPLFSIVVGRDFVI